MSVYERKAHIPQSRHQFQTYLITEAPSLTTPTVTLSSWASVTSLAFATPTEANSAGKPRADVPSPSGTEKAN
jgi:hypothetical protein